MIVRISNRCSNRIKLYQSSILSSTAVAATIIPYNTINYSNYRASFSSSSSSRGLSTPTNTTTASFTTSQSQSTSKSINQLIHNDYDIIIVGGGLVGNSLALSLLSDPITRSLKIAVLEQSTAPKPITIDTPPGLRVSSISPASIELYKSAGIWEELLNSNRLSKFTSMQVWTATNAGRIQWNAADTGVTELGYIIENDLLQYYLYKHLNQQQKQNDSNNANTTVSNTDNSNNNFELLYSIKVNKIELPDDQDNTNQFNRFKPAAINNNNNNSNPPLISDNWPRLYLNNGQIVSTRLLVGADGPLSIVKSAAQLSTVGYEYPQRAVVATIKTNQSHSTAWQRFLPTGPIACLPLYQNYSNIVWSTNMIHSKHLINIKPEQFIQDINQAFESEINPLQSSNGNTRNIISNWIPDSLMALHPILFPKPGSNNNSNSNNTQSSFPPSAIELIGIRASFPLKHHHTVDYISESGRIVLIGDSAHIIHPLAGQGVNLGIADSIELQSIISSAITVGADIGTKSIMKQYNNNRHQHNQRMMIIVDIFQRLFNGNRSLFTGLRGLGLDLFNSIPAIKNAAADYAMGINKQK